MAFKDSYILSVDKFDNRYVEDRDDLANILFDEYSLDYSYVNNGKKLKVLVNSDEDLTKLRKMIKKYSNERGYADDVIEDNTNESIKNIIYNKMRNNRITHRPSSRRVYESRMSRLNRTARPRMIRVNENEDFDRTISRRRAVVESNRPMRFKRDSVLTESARERIKRRIEERRINESRRTLGRKYSFLKESEDAKKCPTSYEGKKIAKMSKAEKRSAASQVKKDIKEAQKMLKEREKKGLSTKAIEAKIEKLQALLDCLTKKEEIKESIRSRFNRSRRIFEAEEETTEEEETEEESNEETEDVEDTDAEDANDTEDTDETEDVDVKAITLKVLNKNVDKLKDALIEAGVEEDDIEVTDNEDAEDDDEVGIKVDVNSFDALKTYCESIGIDLEEELGGEVVSDGDTEEEEDTEDTEEVEADDNSDEDEEDSEFTDAEMDDLFKDM